ncbi:hypothetical protein HBB16_21085 [Pseudonocardia sp. MCCB 268]|nr:hypothetical protein [Pseudonocardia cytotoxica]
MFTDPEVALSEDGARRGGGGLDVRVVELDIVVAGPRSPRDRLVGLVVAVVDTRREVLAGVTFRRAQGR